MLEIIYGFTPLKFFIEPFWRDEAFSYILANKNIIDLLVFTARDFNPPLYYLIIHFWIKIFGSSEISIRTISLLFYWGTMYILFDSMLDIFKFTYKRATVYLFLFIINPLMVYYAFEARMYTQMAFFAALAFYSMFTHKNRLHLAALILGLYTHYFMIFVWMIQYLIIIRKKGMFTNNSKQKKILHIAAISFLPWCLFVLSKKSFDTSDFWLTKVRFIDLINFPAILYTGIEPFLEHFKDLESIYLVPTIILSIVLTTTLVIGYVKKKSEMYSYLLFWAMGVPFLLLIISFFKPVFLPRYLLFTIPGFLLSLAYAMESMRPKGKVLFFALITIGTLTLLGMQIASRNRGREATVKSLKEIAIIAKDRDLVYVESSLDYFTAAYYFDEKRVYISSSSYDEFHDYNGKALIPKEKFTTILPYYPAKAYILKEDGSYEISTAY